MKKSEPFIAHILETLDRVTRFTDGYDFESFEKDEKTHEAVIRQLEIIGEAIKHLKEEFEPDFPEMPWQEIIGMRNHLIHEYWDVNLGDVWHTVKYDLPELKTVIEKMTIQTKP